MKIHHASPLLYKMASWLTAGVLLGGCATSGGPPTQEMSDARQALEAAQRVDAKNHAPAALGGAQTLLSKAEEKLGEGAFEQAQHDAIAAKAEATRARTLALAMGEAKAALQEADSHDALSGGAMELARRAEVAVLANDDETAVRLAREAKQHAERDVNQALLNRAKALLGEIRALQPFASERQTEINAIEAAHQGADGKTAAAAAQRLLDELREMQRRAPPVVVTPVQVVPAPAPVSAPPKMAQQRYTVRRGDSLWKIAARADVYANPRRWPALYQANRQHIKNANIIYPGQVLLIKG